MKLLQLLNSSFKSENNYSINLLKDYFGSDANTINFLQIGIEHPHSIPLFAIEDTDINNNNLDNLSLTITTSKNNGRNYKYHITEQDLVEFYDLYNTNIILTLLEPNNPYIIINIAYDKNMN